MALIAERTGWPPLGLVPFFTGASRLPAEDSLALRGWRAGEGALHDCRADAAGHRQFRRSRPIAPRVRGAAGDGPAWRDAAMRGRPRHIAGLQDHHRRSRGAASRGLGHRPRSSCSPRRPCARPLRRLPDAGAARRRSAGHRRACGRCGRPRLPRHHDRTDRRQEPCAGNRRERRRRCRVSRLRNACGPDRRAGPGAPAAAFRRWPHRWCGLGKRPRRRLLRSRPLRPTMRNAPRFCGGSARSATACPTKPGRKLRSMRSPPIWRPMSISTGLSP